MVAEIRDEVPTVDLYIDIRIQAGLSRKSPEAAVIGLRNGLFSVVAYVGDEAVGIGRIIGDGGCFFEIVDIAVLPSFQKQGIGRKIMERLMDYIHKNALPTAYISLMADHGTPEFYEKFGFEAATLPQKSGMFLRIS